MYPELINLLPESRIVALRRAYFLRVGALALALVSAVTVLTGILLLPTYVYLKAETSARESELRALEATLASSNAAALEERLARLTKQTERLASLADKETASEYMLLALSVPRPGVKLSGFTYKPPSGATPGTLLVGGAAETRDSLRAYQLALLSAPFVGSADLPISAYAKDRNIDFAITLSLRPLP